MYGKTLSIPDALISRYFEFATDISNDELNLIKNDLENNISNPRDIKRRLARSIVELYYDKKAAIDAETNFDKLFIKKSVPDNIPEIKINEQKKLMMLMVENKMAASNGEAKRLIKQGGVKIDDIRVDDINHQVDPKECLSLIHI